MVGQVALAIDGQGQPQRQGRASHDGVDEWPGGGMAMHRLMLERPMPRQDKTGERHRRDHRKRLEEEGEEKPSRVDGEGQKERWKLDTAAAHPSIGTFAAM